MQLVILFSFIFFVNTGKVVISILLIIEVSLTIFCGEISDTKSLILYQMSFDKIHG
ncbi:hypothetical protein [Francisella philomiragia]|uniref:Uncharacterized protein n=1 Tax=Francisella philomiragia TaxID=28110 RepID=A0A0B6D1V5_9GAMM|nr:hypothetical protein [Francisella philomiragia]AJI52312.1 hypothetical protein LA55_1047 [Francisella philomiragia]